MRNLHVSAALRRPSLARLLQKSSNWDLVVPMHDDRVGTFGRRTGELHVTSLLADFLKTGGFETTLDLAEAERIKPRQPLPRYGAPREDAWQPGNRSAIPPPHADYRGPFPPFGPGWQHGRPGIGKRTILPRARQ